MSTKEKIYVAYFAALVAGLITAPLIKYLTSISSPVGIFGITVCAGTIGFFVCLGLLAKVRSGVGRVRDRNQCPYRARRDEGNSKGDSRHP